MHGYDEILKLIIARAFNFGNHLFQSTPRVQVHAAVYDKQAKQLGMSLFAILYYGKSGLDRNDVLYEICSTPVVYDIENI